MKFKCEYCSKVLNYQAKNKNINYKKLKIVCKKCLKEYEQKNKL
jgi:hypothetical protein